MAYSDASPAEIETKLRQPKRPKRTATRSCPTQAEIWPVRFKRLVRFAGGIQATQRRARYAAGRIFLGAAKAAGAAIRNGLLSDRPKRRELTPAELMLAAIDADRDVRRVVGRIDVSGASDGAAWAMTRDEAGGVTLEVFYRHGRDVLIDLAKAVEEVVRRLGWRIGRALDRIRRAPKMEAGVWLASFRLSAPA